MPLMSAASSTLDRRNWRTVRFGGVVRNVKIDADPEASGLDRYVAGEHMNTDNLHIHRWGTIGDGYLGPAFHRKFVRGQVLYGSRRTYLRKVAVADFDGICANTTFVLEPNDEALLPDLLPFIMQTDAFNEHSIKQSRGSVNPYVNWGDLAWYEFLLPSLDEQRRIAEILWATEDSRVGFEATRSAMDRLKSILVSKSVTNGIHQSKSMPSPIGDIPSNWRVSPLGDLLIMCQYGLSIPLSDRGRYPIFRMMNLEDGRVVANNMKFVDLEDADFAIYRVEQGDILFNRTNSANLVGKVGIFHLEGEYV